MNSDIEVTCFGQEFNPPFGIDWKRGQKKVEEEAAKGEQGRFVPGLPKISDGQHKSGIYCESKIFETVEFGYNKIMVERPQRDESGEIVLKKEKPVADANLRDTENMPLTRDIDRCILREKCCLMRRRLSAVFI